MANIYWIFTMSGIGNDAQSFMSVSFIYSNSKLPDIILTIQFSKVNNNIILLQTRELSLADMCNLS